mmetsp:Transcript_31116/g.65212  ORF Transcript_31116/g.65212 Transcript_31116/m.65212 type:complete len:104 (+) Transcript_31116:340-651(+)
MLIVFQIHFTSLVKYSAHQNSRKMLLHWSVSGIRMLFDDDIMRLTSRMKYGSISRGLEASSLSSYQRIHCNYFTQLRRYHRLGSLMHQEQPLHTERLTSPLLN